jgi:uncharacterized protein YecE (DUF72 family)
MSAEDSDNLAEMKSKIAECEAILSQLPESFAKEKVAAVHDILRRNEKIIEGLMITISRSLQVSDLSSNCCIRRACKARDKS